MLLHKAEGMWTHTQRYPPFPAYPMTPQLSSAARNGHWWDFIFLSFFLFSFTSRFSTRFLFTFCLHFLWRKAQRVWLTCTIQKVLRVGHRSILYSRTSNVTGKRAGRQVRAIRGSGSRRKPCRPDCSVWKSKSPQAFSSYTGCLLVSSLATSSYFWSYASLDLQRKKKPDRQSTRNLGIFPEFSNWCQIDKATNSTHQP